MNESAPIGMGTRRQKLAGYLRAANEIRQSYQHSFSRDSLGNRDGDGAGIPGAFPDGGALGGGGGGGGEEIILFPSYARRHTKKSRPLASYPVSSSGKDSGGAGDAEYWRREWEEHEDANAIVDVDVRGWIFTPQSGPLNRKNRLALGIARQLSGIPATPVGVNQVGRASDGSSSSSGTQQEERLAGREAERISRHGQQEADIESRGGYALDANLSASESGGSAPPSRPSSPRPGELGRPLTDKSLASSTSSSTVGRSPTKTSSWGLASDMTPEELENANIQMLKRLRPFFATPSTRTTVTVFFYNDDTSQSRTTTTNDFGHFNLRAALDFAPTDLRVLASETLSASARVNITELQGVSLISDIDDTVKHSGIGSGAREIFRNAFVRDLRDLTLKGVREWYERMHDAGVKLHYVSNSPWQMYTLLMDFFTIAGLPPGSIHLKQYSGMMQGIFEPAAERKKGTLVRVLNDFPDRKFILVGDSGEADLELYTETALAYPGRILGIFIRDVSSTQQRASSDLSSDASRSSRISSTTKPTYAAGNGSSFVLPQRPKLPPRPFTEIRTTAAPEPEEEDLIEFSDDEEKPSTVQRQSTRQPPDLLFSSAGGTSQRPRAAPPTIPKKPQWIANGWKPPHVRSLTGQFGAAGATTGAGAGAAVIGDGDGPTNQHQGYRATVRNKMASAYNSLPSYRSQPQQQQQPDASLHPGGGGGGGAAAAAAAAIASQSFTAVPPLPPRRTHSPLPLPLSSASSVSSSSSTMMTPSPSWSRGVGGGAPEIDVSSASASASIPANTAPSVAANRREELWRRRLDRARSVLAGRRVALKVWHDGRDAMHEAMELVSRYDDANANVNCDNNGD